MTAKYDNFHYFEPVGQVLRRLLAHGPLRRKAASAEVWTAWPKAVGANVATHAQPLRLEAGTLTVIVDSAPWHHQLRFMEAAIVSKLNAELGASVVRKLRFRVGN